MGNIRDVLEREGVRGNTIDRESINGAHEFPFLTSRMELFPKDAGMAQPEER